MVLQHMVAVWQLNHVCGLSLYLHHCARPRCLVRAVLRQQLRPMRVEPVDCRAETCAEARSALTMHRHWCVEPLQQHAPSARSLEVLNCGGCTPDERPLRRMASLAMFQSVDAPVFRGRPEPAVRSPHHAEPLSAFRFVSHTPCAEACLPPEFAARPAITVGPSPCGDVP